MRTSLRLILIEDDRGKGQNVKPLAQAEIAQFDLGRPEYSAELLQALGEAVQEIIGPILREGVGAPKERAG